MASEHAAELTASQYFLSFFVGCCLSKDQSNNPTQTTPARPYNILHATVKMSSSVSTTTHGVVVITHVHPAGNGLGMGAPPPTCMCRTVQIMFGAMAFLFGIVMTFGELSLGVLSGIFVWGSIIYIIAGSLTIAAEKSLNKCLVKASLGMNIVATVTAVTGTVLYSLDAASVFSYCYDYNWLCRRYWAKHQGISGVMALFSLLEIMVTISVSAFACKAVCHSPPEQVFIVGSHLPQGGPVPSQTTFDIPPNSYETLRTPKGAEEGLPAYDDNRPPQYSLAMIT
ncbi:membrane-spanning 4-domains subfamily A member 4A-like isoform X2 [Hypomesus transpacificus]|uniref:membrane-spanning 4-domains subfamily A member 4A-like isoform X2 n=1 Tax=Hypomesus transpacificus TaxID=137520 RepID=UPI001F07DE24|nr:membrane-spanning 4-domains subfamily A member 4A-like isoform X2 [Hypomesus transpacificus]